MTVSNNALRRSTSLQIPSMLEASARNSCAVARAGSLGDHIVIALGQNPIFSIRSRQFDK
jgi:hypothetical protein